MGCQVSSYLKHIGCVEKQAAMGMKPFSSHAGLTQGRAAYLSLFVSQSISYLHWRFSLLFLGIDFWCFCKLLNLVHLDSETNEENCFSVSSKKILKEMESIPINCVFHDIIKCLCLRQNWTRSSKMWFR